MGSMITRVWHKLFASGKDIRILIVGLDFAGKTTLLYKLKFGGSFTAIPTIGFNVEEVSHKNITFTMMDMGS